MVGLVCHANYITGLLCNGRANRLRLGGMGVFLVDDLEKPYNVCPA